MKKSLIFYFSTQDVMIYDVSSSTIYKEKNYIANKLFFDSSDICIDKKKVIAFGNKAYEFYDRTPYDIEVIPCMNRGKIIDFQAQTILLSKIKDEYRLKYGYSTKDAFVLISRFVNNFELNVRLKVTGIKNIKPIYLDNLLVSLESIRNSQGSIVVYFDNDYSFIMATSYGKILFIEKINYNSSELDDILEKYIKFNTTVSISSKQARVIREKFYTTDDDRDYIEISAINNKTSLPVKFKVSNRFYKNVVKIYNYEILKVIKNILSKLPTNISYNCINNNEIYFCGPLSKNLYLKNLVNSTFNVDSKFIDIENDILSLVSSNRSKNA